MLILVFISVLTLTFFIQQFLHRHIQSLAFGLTSNPGCALRLLFYLLYPGIVLHEFSHYLAAKILFVPVNNFDIGIGGPRKTEISLGSVDVEDCDPLRESLIGIAPFVVGIAAILLITNLGFGLKADLNLGFEPVIAHIRTHSYDWTSLLYLYLIFSVSASMIPSASDREPWIYVLIALGIGIVILLLVGWTPRVPADVADVSQHLLEVVTFALSTSLIVNGSVAIALWIFERGLDRINMRRV
ncbi:MAG: hypothetical protein M1282_18670 [Chloroflexi bacterium]|nr:hypothetical protein [Chloroflexota bacterium]